MRWAWSLWLLVPLAAAELQGELKKLSWIVGKWRSEFSGKVFWPTVPTMTYGEELVIQEAPIARSSGIQFLNFSARAWSHSTKDHFHDEWGFLTVNPSGNATLMTTGNNGFTTYEEGFIGLNDDGKNIMRLDLKDIGRISFSRDLPVENLRRTFIKHDDVYLEQVLEMRTATHPKTGLLEHTRVIYQRVPEPEPSAVPDPEDFFGATKPESLAVEREEQEEPQPAQPRPLAHSEAVSAEEEEAAPAPVPSSTLPPPTPQQES